MPKTIADWASIIGFAVTIVNLILIARTKGQVENAVSSTRFEMMKDALIAHCNGALSDLTTMRHLVRQSQWLELSDKCQDVRRTIMLARGSGATMKLPPAGMQCLTKVLAQIGTVEKQAEIAIRDPGRVSVEAIQKALVKQNENVLTVLTDAGTMNHHD